MLQELSEIYSMLNITTLYLIVISITFIHARFKKNYKKAKSSIRSTTIGFIALLSFSLVINHFNDKALAEEAALEQQKVEALEYFDNRMQEFSIYSINEEGTFKETFEGYLTFFNHCAVERDFILPTRKVFSNEFEKLETTYTVNTKDEIDNCIIEAISKTSTEINLLETFDRITNGNVRAIIFVELFGKEPQEVLNECSISKDCPEMLETIAVKTIENIEIQREEIRAYNEEQAKEEAELRAYNEEQRIKAEQAKWEAERPQRMEAKIDAMIKRDAEKQAENDELKAKIEKLEALLEVKEG